MQYLICFCIFQWVTINQWQAMSVEHGNGQMEDTLNQPQAHVFIYIVWICL